MHCAVLGPTGSGKSGAVAAILHSVLAHKAKADATCHPRIIVIDHHGEYGIAFGERATVYRAYDPIGNEGEAGLSTVLTYWLMSAEEFRLLTIAKTENEAKSEHNVISTDLNHPRIRTDGLVNKDPSRSDIQREGKGVGSKG